MTTATSTPATRLLRGCYEYRGYRISHHCDENGDHTGEWDVAECVHHPASGGIDAYNEWVVFDTYNALWYCKDRIDCWLAP